MIFLNIANVFSPFLFDKVKTSNAIPCFVTQLNSRTHIIKAFINPRCSANFIRAIIISQVSRKIDLIYFNDDDNRDIPWNFLMNCGPIL